MNRTCRNCHFLAKEHRDEAGKVYVIALSKEEREKAAIDAGNVVEEYYSLNCHMGVWDEGTVGSGRRNSIINEEKRNNCFFFKFSPGMMCGAAKELQKREQEAKALKTSNMYTRIGLWVAAGAMFANVLVSYWRFNCG